MVQAESDPIAERRERLRALRAAAELASADQGDDEAEKQPVDTTATEQQKEDREEEGREMKFRNYFPRDQQLQQNKHPPPMVPKFEDPIAKAPLETNGAEVNKSILCSLFVLFVCTVLWSKLSVLMRVQPVLSLYISQVVQAVGVD
jgi:hypothetical protein